jgi:ribonuclease E
MSKEIYISSTPHETRLAIVEEEALAEIYYERENEYTLAGSIYNGRVTRVLPGMQSAFVDIGLERDAFLYITDFLEETADPEEFDTSAPRSGGSERSGDRAGRGRRGGRDRQAPNGSPDVAPIAEQRFRPETAEPETSFSDAEAADSTSTDEIGEGAPGADGSRRWRGRRGRRRGRGAHAGDVARSGAPSYPQAGDESQTGVEPADSGFTPDMPSAVDEESQYGERQGRGEQNRGRRDRDQRQSRSPRGFAPSRGELYGIRSDESSGTGPIDNAYGDIHAGGSAGPIILPGESLSKYRKPGEEPIPGTTSAAAAPAASASVTPLAAPATLYTAVAQGWDGGAVLPGEKLSRRSAPAPRNPERANSAQIEHAIETKVERHAEPSPVQEPTAPAEAAVIADAPTPAEPEISVEETEYEPEEASASFRVDPVPPREFRNLPTIDEPAEFTSEAAEESAPAATTSHDETEAVTHDVTSIAPTGEMISEPQLSADEVAASGTLERADETSPIHHEHALVSAEAADVDTAVWPVDVPEREHQDPVEQEPAATTLHASSIEEIDDEEETLEGAADLGVMLREMSIDQITRSDSGQDELDEETLEEIEEFESSREFEAAPEEVAAQGGFSDTAEDEYEDSEAPFDDEQDSRSTDAVAGETAPQQGEHERRGRRDRRDGRRGRGDRHGHGHGNGRARHSVQSTNLPAISDLLKPGQEILVQIAKEPIAKKGARITSHIALPGRFLVFMPTVNHTGVSRKIESDAERRRLKEILLSEKGEASGGFIVRTAADGASEDELRSDLRFLLNLWSDIKTRSESSKSPALIYHDLNLIERILRDQVTDNFSAIWVDTETEYERVLRFLQRFQPSLIRRVKLYTKETPLFEQFGITDEINKALKSKVWLKSGGSIVINQTEALVAIDINTGKFVGKTARLEDTIVKTNLDAIPEIVRQIRLRDLGGIIIIDFIDMDERKNRNRVMAALEDELKKDRAPSKVLQFNDFGLVAITRKRVKQSLERTLSVPCAVCTGTGMVKSPITVCNDIYVEMRKMQKHLDRGDVMLRVHPEVVKQLKSSGAKWLQEMEDMVGKTILVKSDPSLHPEQFDIH